MYRWCIHTTGILQHTLVIIHAVLSSGLYEAVQDGMNPVSTAFAYGCAYCCLSRFVGYLVANCYLCNSQRLKNGFVMELCLLFAVFMQRRGDFVRLNEET